MTALPHRTIGFRAPARARLRARLGGERMRAALLGLSALILLIASVPARADDLVNGKVTAAIEHGFARLVFKLGQPVPAHVSLNWPILIIHFDKPVDVPVDRLNANVPEYISAARRDPDGSAIRIALARKVKLHLIPAGERLFIDLLPEDWAGLLPGLPQDVIDELARRAGEADKLLHRAELAEQRADAKTIRVKVATQPTFTRYVFNLPAGAHVIPERDRKAFTLEFDQPIKWDLGDAVAALPPTLQSIKSVRREHSVAVRFAFKGTPQVRTFRDDDGGFAVDIGHIAAKPKEALAKGAALLAAAGSEAPVIAAPETVPAKGEAASASAEPVHDAADAAPSAPAQPGAPKPAEPKQTSRHEAPTKPPAHKADLKPLKPIVPPPPPQAAPRSPPHRTTGSTRPAPNPNAPVVVGVHRDGDTLQLEFPFAVPTPAAIFRRADMLWLVFDNSAKIDLAKLSQESDGVVRNVAVSRSKDGAAVVRIRLERPRLISVDSDGPAWMVTIGDMITVPSKPLGVARSMVAKDRANIVIPFEHPGKVHRLSDPEVGDDLLVVTGLAPVRGFLRAQDFVELEALASRQGVVVRPIADDVTAKIDNDRIMLSRPGGLALSAAADAQQQAVASFRATAFDNQLWGLDRKADYYKRQSELIRLAAAAPPSRRRLARLNLARFYLAHHMSAEAKGVLDVALSDDSAAADVTGSVLKSVANIMLDRPSDALKDLAQPQVGNQLDAPIWRAIAYSREGKWAEAHKLFKNVETAVAALPLELQRMAMLEALRASVEVRDFNQATQLANECDGIGMPGKLQPAFEVLVGRLDEGLGRTEDALVKYQAAAKSSEGPAAAQAKLREIELRYAAGDMTEGQVVTALETLTTIWRGDETEAEGLRLLAHLYTKEARYRDAFHVMRVALLAHPNSALTRKIRDEAAHTFESLFLSHKGDTLPPIEALGLFYDYRELTPIGRRGDEMIRRLADRLVAVDLLGQAAKLLQHQVDHRLQGAAARAQVATRLAVIYLMDHKPDRALAALRSTRSAGLNDELRDQRLLLEARALSDLGRHDVALEIIQDIKGSQATRLRVDILWAGHHWRQAAEQIELLYGKRWQDFRPLNARERFDILRAAIGYALADEPIGLQRFREKYAAKMESGPDNHAFDVLTAPIGAASAEFRAVANRVASLDTLDAFLSDLRARYPNSGGMSQSDAGKQKAAQGEPQAVAPKTVAPKTVAPKTPKAAPPKPLAPEHSAANEQGKKGATSGTPPKAAPDLPTGSINRTPPAQIP